MFAIIDIETCGSKFELRKGRIIEIAILVHDGLQVVERYSTLVNPECHISSYFTRISGITNDMVADAPTFPQIAKKVLELTEDAIFVAHNVGFDYSFVQDEFRSLGYKYRRETLCTVRLSRKLIPGLRSYSLGKLCESLGIDVYDRHRALGDAEATVKLFDLLIQVKSNHPQYKNQGVEKLMARKVDAIKEYILKKLPEECGVYYFLNQEKEVIYVGKSRNMYQRAIQHFGSDEAKRKKMLAELMDVDYVETGSELVALLMESAEIKKHKPKYNRVRKAEDFAYAIDTWEMDGIVHFQIVDSDKANAPLQFFPNYTSAREKLDGWIEEHTLCLSYCHLTEEGSVCFNHHIKQCNGICAGEEDPIDYSIRAKRILAGYHFPYPTFMLIDRGRFMDERAIVLIENHQYAGYAYVDSNQSISSLDELKSLIVHDFDFPDANELIRAWIRQNGLNKLKPIQ
jgi:DNA polymerase-3 subunit epsilon